jgi:hypothetical protein
MQPGGFFTFAGPAVPAGFGSGTSSGIDMEDVHLLRSTAVVTLRGVS